MTVSHTVQGLYLYTRTLRCCNGSVRLYQALVRKIGANSEWLRFSLLSSVFVPRRSVFAFPHYFLHKIALTATSMPTSPQPHTAASYYSNGTFAAAIPSRPLPAASLSHSDPDASGNAVLELGDGSAYSGISFGAPDKSVAGECVFQTGECSLFAILLCSHPKPPSSPS